MTMKGVDWLTSGLGQGTIKRVGSDLFSPSEAHRDRCSDFSLSFTLSHASSQPHPPLQNISLSRMITSWLSSTFS